MNRPSLNRRMIVSAGALLAGAGAAPAAMAQSTAPGGGSVAYGPAFEAQDAWLDNPATRHRIVFDTIWPTAAPFALFFADNFYKANKSGYGLDPAVLGVVIVLRHKSTAFGFNDLIWSKYGDLFAKILKLEAAQAIRAVKGNPLLSTDPAIKSSNDSVTITTLAAHGTKFAICGMATHHLAEVIAKAQTGVAADAIEKEMRSNLIPGGVMTAAGLVTFSRAQERGYTSCYVPEE